MSRSFQVHDLTVKLVEPVKILLVVGIASTLAQAAWLLMLGPVADGVGVLSASEVADTRGSTLSLRLPGGEIARLHLFGEISKVNATPLLPDDAPETRLRLELEGIFLAEDAKLSWAIIAEQNKPGQLYQIGDQVTPSVRLAAVREDRVILRRGANYETLSFSDEDNVGIKLAKPTRQAARTNPRTRLGRAARLQSGQVEQPANLGPTTYPTNTARGGGITSVKEFVDVYRSRLDEDPEGTLSSLGIVPVASNGSEGYRLGNVTSNPYLSQAGLQPGDVILSVNGRPVGDIQSDRREIDNIIAQGSARIEIVRGSRRFFVTASLR
jgi:general secretion pathway protein C